MTASTALRDLPAHFAAYFDQLDKSTQDLLERASLVEWVTPALISEIWSIPFDLETWTELGRDGVIEPVLVEGLNKDGAWRVREPWQSRLARYAGQNEFLRVSTALTMANVMERAAHAAPGSRALHAAALAYRARVSPRLAADQLAAHFRHAVENALSSHAADAANWTIPMVAEASRLIIKAIQRGMQSSDPDGDALCFAAAQTMSAMAPDDHVLDLDTMYRGSMALQRMPLSASLKWLLDFALSRLRSELKQRLEVPTTAIRDVDCQDHFDEHAIEWLASASELLSDEHLAARVTRDRLDPRSWLISRHDSIHVETGQSTTSFCLGSPRNVLAATEDITIAPFQWQPKRAGALGDLWVASQLRDEYGHSTAIVAPSSFAHLLDAVQALSAGVEAPTTRGRLSDEIEVLGVIAPLDATLRDLSWSTVVQTTSRPARFRRQAHPLRGVLGGLDRVASALHGVGARKSLVPAGSLDGAQAGVLDVRFGWSRSVVSGSLVTLDTRFDADLPFEERQDTPVASRSSRELTFATRNGWIGPANRRCPNAMASVVTHVRPSLWVAFSLGPVLVAMAAFRRWSQVANGGGVRVSAANAIMVVDTVVTFATLAAWLLVPGQNQRRLRRDPSGIPNRIERVWIIVFLGLATYVVIGPPIVIALVYGSGAAEAVALVVSSAAGLITGMLLFQAWSVRHHRRVFVAALNRRTSERARSGRLTLVRRLQHLLYTDRSHCAWE